MQRVALIAAVPLLAGAMLLASCSSCSRKKPPRAAVAQKGRPIVYVSTYPLQYFAERIAGGRLEVRTIVPVGGDAEHYVPGAETVRALHKADLILINGALLEKWLRRVLLPESRVVDTTRPLRSALIILDEIVTHSHGPRGAHTHEGVVAQTWLDPRHASVQAGEVAKALSGLLPGHASAFEEHLAGLEEDLRKLDAAFAETFEDHGARHVVFSHPVYEYLVKRYELNATSLELEPTEMPGEEIFESIGRMLKTKPARFIIWEHAPSGEIAKRFGEELGLESTYFETCTTLTQEHVERGFDYFAIMERNLANTRAVFAPVDSTGR